MNKRLRLCEHATKKDNRIICKKSDGYCAHQRWCGVEGTWIHTDLYLKCPQKTGGK